MMKNPHEARKTPVFSQSAILVALAAHDCKNMAHNGSVARFLEVYGIGIPPEIKPNMTGLPSSVIAFESSQSREIPIQFSLDDNKEYDRKIKNYKTRPKGRH